MNSYDAMLFLRTLISEVLELPVYQIQQKLVQRRPLPYLTIQEVLIKDIMLGNARDIEEVSYAYNARYQIDCYTNRIDVSKVATQYLQKLRLLIFDYNNLIKLKNNNIAIVEVTSPKAISFVTGEDTTNSYRAMLEIEINAVLTENRPFEVATDLKGGVKPI